MASMPFLCVPYILHLAIGVVWHFLNKLFEKSKRPSGLRGGVSVTSNMRLFETTNLSYRFDWLDEMVFKFHKIHFLSRFLASVHIIWDIHYR